MAFGNLITDGVQVAVGTVGYVVAFDLTGSDPDSVTQIQLQASGTTMSAVYTDQATLADLYGYLENSAAPIIAWNQSGNSVYVFTKTATYPYTSATRIGFWFYRNAQNVALVTEKLDIPPEARDLFKLLVFENMYRSLNRQVPTNILNSITNEKKVLGL